MRINLNESKLMDYYEKMSDDMYLKYFTFPSDFPYLPIGEVDRENASYHEAMGRGHAANLPSSSGGDRVVYHGDPKYCNGLRRR